MKKLEFRKLIREEIKRVLSEQSQKAYALIIEDDMFSVEDLAEYSKNNELDDTGFMLKGDQAFDYAAETEATEDITTLQKWMDAVKKMLPSYVFYDVTAGAGEDVVVAAIPKGSKLQDYISVPEDDDEDDNQGDAVRNLFHAFARTLPPTFNIKTFAKKVGLSPENAEKALLKLEPSDTLKPQLVSKIMDDIVSGNYDSFKLNLPKIYKAKKIATKSAARKYFK